MRSLTINILAITLLSFLPLPIYGSVSKQLTEAGLMGDRDLLNWAYSAAFGTGYYTVGDDSVYILTTVPKVPVDWFEDYGLKATFRLPLTFGVQNLDLGEIGDVLDLDNLKTITFVPGIDFRYFVSEKWELRPYAHIGMGTERTYDERATIHYFGVNSWYQLPSIGTMDLHLFNGLQWFGQNPKHGPSDSFARLVNGLEGSYRLGDFKIGGRQIFLEPHVVHYWYFDSIGFDQILNPPLEIKQEYEIGLSLALEERISLKVMGFDRIGISYRGGADIKGFRIYMSSVFE